MLALLDRFDAGTAIPTLQALLGLRHQHVPTTMTYTHTADPGPLGLAIPLAW